jgi:hypothetical protein
MPIDDRYGESLRLFQYGVVSRTQALAGGLTTSELRHRIRDGGPWTRLLPGIYVMTTGTPTQQQREVAALLYAGPGTVITGLTALRGDGLRLAPDPIVDVLVPAARKRASREFVIMHRTYKMARIWAPDLAIRYAPPARAVADAVRAMTDLREARAIVAGAVQQRLCTVELLEAELASGPVRGSALLRTVLAEVADGIRSVPEGDLRRLIKAAGLPEPLYNPRLFLDGKFLASPDAWWRQAGVIAEVDSRQWHATPEGWAATMKRHNRLVAVGLAVLHFTPRELRTEPDEVVRRIAAALQAGRPAPGVTTKPAAA